MSGEIMGLVAYMKESSGRAMCGICGKVIEKTQKRILIKGYREGMSIHNNPSDCIPGRRWK